jgi:5'-3' exoribonuclease 1
MDCNSIIYDVYYTIINSSDPKLASIAYADMESRLICGVIEKILKCVSIVCPTQTVFIAFDGVAPFAKMEQQRTRRYRSWLTETLFETTPGSSIKSDYPIYSGMFTPGTPFMMKLSKDVSQFFEKMSKSQN